MALTVLGVLASRVAAARADGQCIVRTDGAFVSDVEIEIAGAEPITLDVQGSDFVSVEVPARTERFARVHVASSLALDGRMPSRSVQWRWGYDRVSIGGVLTVEPGGSWQIGRVWSRGAQAHATLTMDDARIADAIVPCNAFALPSARSDPEAIFEVDSASPRTRRAFRVRVLHVRATPHAPVALTLVLAHPEWFEVGVIRETADSAYVRQRGYGYVLEGWVARGELRRVARFPGATDGFSGRSARVRGCFSLREEDLWIGPGAVTIGTAVVDRPGGTAWATVTTNQALLVSHRERSDWIAIVGAPGLTFGGAWCTAPRAWVPTSAVALGVAHGASIPLGRPPPSNELLRVSPTPPRHESRPAAPEYAPSVARPLT